MLEALVRALQFDEAEPAHLFDLARAANTSSPAVRGRRRSTSRLRPRVQRLLDVTTMAPAYVRNGRLDVLRANAPGRAVFAPLFDAAAGTPNIARFIFLDPARRAFTGIGKLAGDTVALLRAEAGRNRYDRALTDVIGELSTRSEVFRTWWAAHNVRLHRSGVKHLHHPVVGELVLAYESLDLTTDTGLRLNAYGNARIAGAGRGVLPVPGTTGTPRLFRCPVR